MYKLNKKVSNPMTVIAMFALISETSAAVSLPFLANQEREIYIWFLISFPFYLLFLFFLTLNFNYRSLYAPSDFTEDENFLRALDDEAPIDDNQPINSMDACAPHTASIGDRADTSVNSRYLGKVPDPPHQTIPQASTWFEHYIQIPMMTNTLRVIDVRHMDTSSQFDKLRLNLRRPAMKPFKLMIFITNDSSDNLLQKTALSHIKHSKKRLGRILYIAYNVSQETTMILR